MTENKRFYLDENGINDREYEFSILGEDELVDIINELNEENEQLKRRNRGLQSELQIFKEDVTHSNLQINKLIDDNEQLKKENKTLADGLTAYFESKIKRG